MEFDCTKPLGDKLESYLEDDLASICFELSTNGIVYESQFAKLFSMVCKQNATQLTALFSKRTELDILYGYESVTCNFFFYNTEVYTREEAMRLSIEYQEMQE